MVSEFGVQTIFRKCVHKIINIEVVLLFIENCKFLLVHVFSGFACAQIKKASFLC